MEYNELLNAEPVALEKQCSDAWLEGFSLYLGQGKASLESCPQSLLQVFILLSNANRLPTGMQWLSIVSSALAVSLPEIRLLNIVNNGGNPHLHWT